jgi:hypothetical protein
MHRLLRALVFEIAHLLLEPPHVFSQALHNLQQFIELVRRLSVDIGYRESKQKKANSTHESLQRAIQATGSQQHGDDPA